MKIEKSDLLLVVDVQNVYLPGEAWACYSLDKKIPNMIKLIRKFPKEQVIYTIYRASEQPQGQWKQYNIENADINADFWANAYVKDLQPYVKEGKCFYKSTYSCCSNEALLKEIEKYQRIFLVGVVAECCVLSTAFELIDLGKKVIWIRDGISGENEEKEVAIEKILEGLSPLHIEFCDSFEAE